MKDPRDDPSMREEREGDDRLIAYLDGEMGEEEAREFERLLDSDPSLRQRGDALLKMNNWLDRTRRPAPDGFAEGVERAISARVAEGADPHGSGIRDASLGAEDRSFSALDQWTRRLRWTWAPALVGAAAVLFFLIRGDSGRVPDERVEPAQMATVESDEFIQEFRFEAADAEEICLVGDFNQWKVCETPLERVEENIWTVKIPLSEGRHEYMFVVDGEWRIDPAASFRVDDGFGNQNAVVYL